MEPYNAILTTHSTIANSDCAFMVDNEALYNLCLKRLGVDNPNYKNLNMIVAQVNISPFLTNDTIFLYNLIQKVCNL